MKTELFVFHVFLWCPLPENPIIPKLPTSLWANYIKLSDPQSKHGCIEVGSQIEAGS